MTINEIIAKVKASLGEKRFVHTEGCVRMAEKLAEIRGLTVEEIHAVTLENGKRLYRI